MEKDTSFLFPLPSTLHPQMDEPLRCSTLRPEGFHFTGGISINRFDTTIVRGPIDFPFFRLVSVRTGALEFYKATVVASDLPTGGATSNRRPTICLNAVALKLSDRG